MPSPHKEIFDNVIHPSLSTGLPSPPQAPSYNVLQYHQDTVNLTLQWQPPLYNGGTPVNYAITVTSDLTPDPSPDTTYATSVSVTVPYNTAHNVSIVAINCIGRTSATLENIIIGMLSVDISALCLLEGHGL